MHVVNIILSLVMHVFSPACTESSSPSLCLCSFSRRLLSGVNDGALQADHEDRGSHGPLSGSDPKLPEGHPSCQHQLRGVRAHQVHIRCAVQMKSL